MEHTDYMSGWECVNHNQFIGWATIFLCFTILAGYLRIAYHWYSNLRGLKPGLAKTSLFNMVNIFLFCGICGYLLIIIMMWFPIWEIRCCLLAILAFFTWRYAIYTPNLKVVYEEIHHTGELAQELEDKKKTASEIRTKTQELNKPIAALSDSVVFGIDENTKPETVDQINRIRYEIGQLSKSFKELEDLLKKS